MTCPCGEVCGYVSSESGSSFADKASAQNRRGYVCAVVVPACTVDNGFVSTYALNRDLVGLLCSRESYLEQVSAAGESRSRELTLAVVVLVPSRLGTVTLK